MENIVDILQATLPIAICILMIAANWKIFEKLGIAGWKCLIPIYGQYCLLDELYGSGIKILFYLIPVYGVYFSFKVSYDLVKSLGHGTGFFFGYCLFPPLFTLSMAIDRKGYVNNICDGMCVPALILMFLPVLVMVFLMLMATPLGRMFMM